jgi:hypothetical protein
MNISEYDLFKRQNEHIGIRFIQKAKIQRSNTIKTDLSKWICPRYVPILRAANCHLFFLELKGVIVDQPSVKFPLGRSAVELVRVLVQ